MKDLQQVISEIMHENLERISIFITDEIIEQIVEKTLEISGYKEAKYIQIKNKVRDELRSFLKNVN